MNWFASTPSIFYDLNANFPCTTTWKSIHFSMNDHFISYGTKTNTDYGEAT